MFGLLQLIILVVVAYAAIAIVTLMAKFVACLLEWESWKDFWGW